jgi:hypothetical protein
MGGTQLCISPRSRSGNKMLKCLIASRQANFIVEYNSEV